MTDISTTLEDWYTNPEAAMSTYDARWKRIRARRSTTTNPEAAMTDRDTPTEQQAPERTYLAREPLGWIMSENGGVEYVRADIVSDLLSALQLAADELRDLNRWLARIGEPVNHGIETGARAAIARAESLAPEVSP